jgi:hypothetical protein
MNRIAKIALAAVIITAAIQTVIALRPGKALPPFTDGPQAPVAREEAPVVAPAPVAEPAPVQKPAPAESVRLTIAPDRRASIRQSLPAFDAGQDATVPFASFAHGKLRATFRFTPGLLQGRLDLEGGGVLALPARRIPLALLDAGADNAVVIARDLFSGSLWLYLFDGTQLAGEAVIIVASDAQPILRAATMHNGELVVVLFDNARSANDVVTLALPKERSGAGIAPVLHTKLATLEDPAGGTYEMIPTIRLFVVSGRLFALGGTLLQQLNLGTAEVPPPQRLSGCLRAQDAAVVGEKLHILCLSRAQGPDQPYQSAAMVISPGTPVFRLLEYTYAEGIRERSAIMNDLVSLTAQGELFRGEGKDGLRKILLDDLHVNHASGIMELGINNVEGRVAWSQIYFLNGLMDLLSLALSDETAADFWQPILSLARQRLDLEIHLLDRLMQSEFGFRTKAFTVGREPAIFAVQTSRLLLLFNRYRRLFPEGVTIASLPRLRRTVLSLDGHIDVLTTAGPDSVEPEPGRKYLHWPKGSAFYFDGLNVPYNHQNEWAYAVFDTLKDSPAADTAEQDALAASTDIIIQFIGAIAPQGEMPASGMWPYWWGKAREGWTANEGTSRHRPDYPGDRLTAWISFRSIDVMSVLAASPHLARAREPALRNSIAALVHAGLVYPFVAASFDSMESLPLPNRAAAVSYGRMTAPSDLQSAVYAYYTLARSR